MTNPAVIANRLATLDNALDAGWKELDAAVKEYQKLGIQAADADMEAEVAYARAFLSVDGPEYYRKQLAIQESAQLRHKARIANHLVTTQKEALFALREGLRRLHTQIDSARTMAANERAQISIDSTSWRP
jgi:hypothetical protein